MWMSSTYVSQTLSLVFLFLVFVCSSIIYRITHWLHVKLTHSSLQNFNTTNNTTDHQQPRPRQDQPPGAGDGDQSLPGKVYVTTHHYCTALFLLTIDSSILTDIRQLQSRETLRAQPWRSTSWSVHRRQHQPKIPRREPGETGDWRIPFWIFWSWLLYRNHASGCPHSLQKYQYHHLRRDVWKFLE